MPSRGHQRGLKNKEKAREDLWEILRDKDKVVGVGISEGEIVVNVEEETDEVLEEIPGEYEGYSIEVKETGEIEAYEEG